MAGKQEEYLIGDARKFELQFLAKRLVDFSKDFGKLNEEEKRYVIESSYRINGTGLFELYKSLDKIFNKK
ncbi:MAG: hypothetical protein RBR71_11100 [Gudongella sp.]|nr:hypothetical protein [Gudongella sp.]